MSSMEIDESKNESAVSSFLGIIGRVGTNRLKFEFLDDAKQKADSIHFDNNYRLTKQFIECKSKG